MVINQKNILTTAKTGFYYLEDTFTSSIYTIFMLK